MDNEEPTKKHYIVAGVFLTILLGLLGDFLYDKLGFEFIVIVLLVLILLK